MIYIATPLSVLHSCQGVRRSGSWVSDPPPPPAVGGCSPATKHRKNAAVALWQIV